MRKSMRLYTITTIAFLLAGSISICAQPVEEAYMEVEEYPVLPGCDNLENGRSARRLCTEQKLVQYLRDSLHFSHDRQVMGNTEVQFIVETDGTVKDVKLLHHMDAELDAKIIQIFRSIKGFLPGQISGIAVRTLLRMPISFQPEQELERVEFASFSELLCKSYRNTGISTALLINLVENAPDSLTLCNERRKLKRAILTLSDPDQKSEAFQITEKPWKISANLRRSLTAAYPGSRLYLQLFFEVSGIEIEVNHDIYIE